MFFATWRSWQAGGWGSAALFPRGGWHRAWHEVSSGLINSCRVAGGASLSPSLGAAGDACSLQPAATARPLCPHGRLPVQRNRRLGCATQPYLRPFADSPGPGKGVYQPGHLCPGRFRGAESLEGSLAGGRAHPHWPGEVPSSRRALGAQEGPSPRLPP